MFFKDFELLLNFLEDIYLIYIFNFFQTFRVFMTIFAPQNYGAMQTLLHKIMEQCRLCPANSWSLHSLPRKIMEQCKLCSAK